MFLCHQFWFNIIPWLIIIEFNPYYLGWYGYHLWKWYGVVYTLLYSFILWIRGTCPYDPSVGQPVNSTRRCAVPVDPRDTDTAYRLNHHIIWEQAVVIRLCEAIRPAYCLTLLSPRRLILIPWPLHYFDDIDFWNMNKSLSFSFMRILSE